MMFLKSFQLKMAFWAVLLSGSTLLLFVFGSSYYMRGEIEEFLSQDSKMTTELVFQLAEDRELLLHTLQEMERMNLRVDAEGDYEVKFAVFRVEDPAGEVIYHLGEELSAEDLEEIHGSDQWVYHSGIWKLKSFTNPSGWNIILGANIHETDYEYIELLQVFFIMLPVFLFVLAVGSWTMGRRAVSPLKTLSAQITGVEASSLSMRVTEDKGDTEVVTLAHQINHMLDRIEKAYAQVKRFNADLSHELRTPLAVMQAELIDQLDNGGHKIEDQQRIARLLEEVSRLKALTHSLLFLGRAEAGVWNEPKVEFDLHELLQELKDSFEELFKEKKIELEWNVDFPARTFSGYPDLMAQALRNLLQNALKYTSEDGFVRLDCRENGKVLIVDVANSALPMDAEMQERIFERFYRGDASRSRTQGGFGLGLNLAREIIHLHQGKLAVEKSDEKETVFRIEIPIE